MMQTVLVAGLSGRLGRVLVPHLTSAGLQLEPLGRELIEDFASGRGNPATRFESTEISGLINLAGMAHVPSRAELDEVELWRANVELPLLLQQLAHSLGIRFVHLSSTKADRPRRGPQSPYGQSKRAAEILLQSAQLKARSASQPTRVVRSCAVLAPPYEAGRLSLLRKLSPRGLWLAPNLRLPVIDPAMLAKTILTALRSDDPSPYTVHEINEGDMVRARQVVKQLHASG